MPELLGSLNEAQREAVVNYDSPSLIIAGAGSGKTRVLTSRIAYMLRQGVEPWRILALTFTNKAANEMRERISTMVPKEQSDRLWMGTFHSIFLRILRYEVDKLGYPKNFTIYDMDDSRNLVKKVIKQLNLSDESYKPAAIVSRISLAKNNLVGPDAYAANTAYIAEDRESKIPEFLEIYKAYSAACRANGAMDFDDMLYNINVLFRDFPDVLRKYQEHFKYVLVDEYQDTNYAQYIIIRRLAELHSNICVVGDDAQSIYSFRGAKIENILRFRNDYPQVRTFKLEQNYRSTQTIVNAANSVIEKNKNRLDKSSFSKSVEGEKIRVLKAYTDQEEAMIVASHIRDLVRDSEGNWNDVAILYRTNMQSRVFEEALRRRSIPYKIYGGMSFYQRKEIKDILSYIKLIVNPGDNEAYLRVINTPTRGIGGVTVSRIADAATQQGISLFEMSRRGDLAAAGLNGGAEKKVREFAQMIDALSEKTNSEEIYKFGLDVATQSGILGELKTQQTPEAQSAVENIEELLNSMQIFAEQELPAMEFDQMSGEPIEGESTKPSVADWLQNVALITDMDSDEQTDGRVTLMTIHASKGLEYPFIFIVGVEENLFPSINSLYNPDGLEEERRLFYVALTRAEKQVVLSFSESRFKWGSMEFCRPSRFLSEIDAQYLEMDFELEDPRVESQTRIEDAGGERRSQGYRRGSNAGGASGQRWGSGQRGAHQRGGYGAQKERPESVVPQKEPDRERFRSMGRDKPTQSANTESGSAPVSRGGYTVGQRVSHAKFGIGEIIQLESSGDDMKVIVEFEDRIAGKKTLLSKFAKLDILP